MSEQPPDLTQLIKANQFSMDGLIKAFRQSGLLNFETVHEPRYRWLRFIPLRILKAVGLTDEIKVYHSPIENSREN